MDALCHKHAALISGACGGRLAHPSAALAATGHQRSTQYKLAYKANLMTEASAAARAVHRLSTGIVVLAIVDASAATTRHPPLILGVWALALIPVVLALLSARGIRWARTLLTGFTIFQVPSALGSLSESLSSLPPLAHLVYVVGTSLCVVFMHRQPAAGYFQVYSVEDSGARRARRFVMFGATAAVLLVSFVLVSLLINRIAAERGVRPDFGTNGLNWYAAGVGLIGGPVFPGYLAFLLYVVCPGLHHSPRWRRTWLLTPTGLAVSSVLPLAGLLLLGVFSGQATDRLATGAIVGPALLGVGIASWWHLRRLDSESNGQVSSPE